MKEIPCCLLDLSKMLTVNLEIQIQNTQSDFKRILFPFNLEGMKTQNSKCKTILQESNKNRLFIQIFFFLPVQYYVHVHTCTQYVLEAPFGLKYLIFSRKFVFLFSLTVSQHY